MKTGPFASTHIWIVILMFSLCLFQYLTYEDCLKEAYAAAQKCRASNGAQLTVNIYQICDEYQDKLKRLCLAHCAKGLLS